MARLLVAALAVSLLALSLVAGYFEAQPFLTRAGSLDERAAQYAKIEEGSHVARLNSRFARRARIVACLDTMRALGAAGETPRPVIEGCLHVAESNAAYAPLSSNDWYLAAALAERLGDTERVRRYLLLSFESGPNEQWIAERRAPFAYRLRDGLDPALRERTDRDFLLLLRTNAGVRALAQRFVDDPGLREYLVSLAETTEPLYQQRLLDEVRRVVRESGS